jgi:hypothetical protein
VLARKSFYSVERVIRRPFKHRLPNSSPSQCYAGSVEGGPRIAAPLKKFGPPTVGMLDQIPYTAFQRLPEPLNPAGLTNYWKAHYLKTFDYETIDSIIGYAAEAPPPFSEIHVKHMGVAVKCVSEDESAFDNKEGEFALNIMESGWTQLNPPKTRSE